MLTSTRFAWLLVFLIFPLSHALASLNGAQRLADLSTLPEVRSGLKSAPVAVGDRLFFAGFSAGAGTELMVLEPGGAAPRRVRDITPGAASSLIGKLQPFGPGVLFAVTQDDRTSLWVSDGTEAGTRRVSPAPSQGHYAIASPVQIHGRCAWYAAQDDRHGIEPWRFCLDEPAVQLVSDIVPGTEGSDPYWFVFYDDTVLFDAAGSAWAAHPGKTGVEPFNVPGAPDLEIEGFFQVRLAQRTYFRGTAALTGTELWSTDGTPAGTRIVADLMPGPESSFPFTPVVDDGAIIFTAATPDDGHQLHRYVPGTPAPVLLARTEPTDWLTWGLGTHGGYFYFCTFRLYNQFAMYRVDLATASVESLTLPEQLSFDPVGVTFSVVNDVPLVWALSLESTFHLWSLPGRGDLNVRRTTPPTEEREAQISGLPVPWAGQWVFAGRSDETGVELWSTQGTPETTQPILNLAPDDNGGSPFYFADAGQQGTAIIGPGEGPRSAGLWLTQGTPETTSRRASFDETPASAPAWSRTRIQAVRPLGESLVFSVIRSERQQTQLYRLSDGEVTLINQPGFAVAETVGNQVIGVGLNGEVGATGGQAGDLRVLARSGAERSIYTQASDYAFYFYADTLDGTTLLWRSNGAVDGTFSYPGVRPIPVLQFPQFAGALDDAAFVVRRNNGTVLWRADANGAREIARVGGSASLSDPHLLASATLDSRIVFMVDIDRFNGLWATDGTSQGTERLIKSQPPGGGWIESPFVSWRDAVYFLMDGDLWRTEGTAQSTRRVATVPGALNQLQLYEMGGTDSHLYFVGQTEVSGDEIWRTDGVRFEQVTELMPGSLSAAPEGLQAIDGRVYFSADDGVYGREPYVLDSVVAP